MENTEQPSLEQQIAEAEERGYRRGLNEQIEQRMQEPGTWESAEEAPSAHEPEGFKILANTAKSIWD